MWYIVCIIRMWTRIILQRPTWRILKAKTECMKAFATAALPPRRQMPERLRRSLVGHLEIQRWMSSNRTPQVSLRDTPGNLSESTLRSDSSLEPSFISMIKPVRMLCVGGTIGASYGSYRGYMLNRHKSYNNCAIETTIYCFIGTGVGVWAVFMSPILIPILCVCVPVAGGAMIAKYFDKNANDLRSQP
jgi:hypothetical protein